MEAGAGKGSAAHSFFSSSISMSFWQPVLGLAMFSCGQGTRGRVRRWVRALVWLGPRPGARAHLHADGLAEQGVLGVACRDRGPAVSDQRTQFLGRLRARLVFWVGLCDGMDAGCLQEQLPPLWAKRGCRTNVFVWG